MVSIRERERESLSISLEKADILRNSGEGTDISELGKESYRINRVDTTEFHSLGCHPMLPFAFRCPLMCAASQTVAPNLDGNIAQSDDSTI